MLLFQMFSAKKDVIFLLASIFLLLLRLINQLSFSLMHTLQKNIFRNSVLFNGKNFAVSGFLLESMFLMTYEYIRKFYRKRVSNG
jgi:hypothetical protein